MSIERIKAAAPFIGLGLFCLKYPPRCLSAWDSQYPLNPARLELAQYLSETSVQWGTFLALQGIRMIADHPLILGVQAHQGFYAVKKFCEAILYVYNLPSQRFYTRTL